MHYDRRVVPDGLAKEEAFWHVVSRTVHGHPDRLIDPRRAERIGWIRPTIESPCNDSVVAFDHDPGRSSKGVRTYLWLEDHDYVVILQARRSVYWLVTAFYITRDDMREDFRKRSATAQKCRNRPSK